MKIKHTAVPWETVTHQTESVGSVMGLEHGEEVEIMSGQTILAKVFGPSNASLKEEFDANVALFSNSAGLLSALRYSLEILADNFDDAHTRFNEEYKILRLASGETNIVSITVDSIITEDGYNAWMITNDYEGEHGWWPVHVPANSPSESDYELLKFKVNEYREHFSDLGYDVQLDIGAVSHILEEGGE